MALLLRPGPCANPSLNLLRHTRGLRYLCKDFGPQEGNSQCKDRRIETEEK